MWSLICFLFGLTIFPFSSSPRDQIWDHRRPLPATATTVWSRGPPLLVGVLLGHGGLRFGEVFSFCFAAVGAPRWVVSPFGPPLLATPRWSRPPSCSFTSDPLRSGLGCSNLWVFGSIALFRWVWPFVPCWDRSWWWWYVAGFRPLPVIPHAAAPPFRWVTCPKPTLWC